MIKKLSLLVLFVLTSVAFGQKPAYIIYNAKGKKVSYKKMLKRMAKKDVVLFGELHNNPISHWLQYELTSDLSKQRSLMLGAEMFEADNQQEFNNYLSDSITAKALDTLARLWPNYKPTMLLWSILPKRISSNLSPAIFPDVMPVWSINPILLPWIHFRAKRKNGLHLCLFHLIASLQHIKTYSL